MGMVCLPANGAGVVIHPLQVQGHIGGGQGRSCVARPLAKLQANGCKYIAKTSVLPLLGIGETVKVKVPNGQFTALMWRTVGFDHGIGGAFDAPGHSQCRQQVAHPGGFTAAQFTMQVHNGVARHRQAQQSGGHALGAGDGGGLIGPLFGVNHPGVIQGAGVLIDRVDLWGRLQAWAQELGFSQIGVSGVDLTDAEPGLLAWLAQGFHGEMAYMASHGLKRARPGELIPGTLSVITARMDYRRPEPLAWDGEHPTHKGTDWQGLEWQRLAQPAQGVVSMYARGRDYHKVMRQRLQLLADRLQAHIGPTGHRVFTDSAPVLEVELAQRSGLGWRGKHTLLLNREGGSMFFLGEVFVDLALTPTPAQSDHCGSCTACIDVCPTQAIVASYRLDARRCISYLTIEHPGSIDPDLRPLMGNRVYGCDDCQLACPWNKYAQVSTLPDFAARATWTDANLLVWMSWSEADFLRLSEGSAIRRIGHVRWLRNVAIAMGNALRASQDAGWCAQAAAALQSRLPHPDPLVREHVQWALDQIPLA